MRRYSSPAIFAARAHARKAHDQGDGVKRKCRRATKPDAGWRFSNPAPMKFTPADANCLLDG